MEAGRGEASGVGVHLGRGLSGVVGDRIGRLNVWLEGVGVLSLLGATVIVES